MKRLITVALVVCMIVCVVSCGKPKTDNPPVETPVVTPPQEPTEKLMDITVYFPDDNMMYLHPVVRTVDVADGVYKVVAENVISGPEEGSSYVKPIRGDVKVLSAELDTATGVCTLDLSEDFAKNNTGGTTREIMAVYSLVDSLCELDGVKSVKINIAGETNPEFGGHFSLELPFEKQESYIRE